MCMNLITLVRRVGSVERVVVAPVRYVAWNEDADDVFDPMLRCSDEAHGMIVAYYIFEILSTKFNIM